MVKKRAKMYRSNRKIKEFLKNEGFHSLYLFPHMRHMKDYIFEDCGFDALGWQKGDKRIWLFQFKTNCSLSKKEAERYKKIEKKYNCRCAWMNCIDRKGVIMECSNKWKN